MTVISVKIPRFCIKYQSSNEIKENNTPPIARDRANISRSTIQLVEKGSPNVAMGSYLQVLFVLGLEKDLLKVAFDDPLGRKLQDAQLIK
ncbi:MAG: hypothetical protein ACTHK8_09765 [Ginsengibacter sp.]